MSANQLKYLLTFLHQSEKGQNQAAIAKLFGVNKSTISRALLEAAKQGILADTKSGYQLTGYGKEYIQHCERNLEYICNWLISEGADLESAREDCYVILENCSETTLEIIGNKGKIAKIYKGLECIKNSAVFSGKEIIEFMEPGEYETSFVFYQIGERTASKSQPSMANDAFEHPAVLSVSASGSYICLRMKNIVQKSKISGEAMEGKLKTMKYQSGTKEKIVMLNDEKVYIPIEVMEFFYIRKDNILRGHMEFKMTCTVGNMHMPESKAVLMIYL